MERITIDLKKIFQNSNSRSIYRDQDLQELMESMSQDGLLHPIGVQKNGAKYEVIFGNRRFMAATKLGWHEIACTVVDMREDDSAEVLNLVENIKRVDIPIHDEGRIYESLIKKGLTIHEICAKMGVKYERVKNCLDAFRYVPKEFRHKVMSTINRSPQHKGKISAAAASTIITVAKDNGLSRPATAELFTRAIEEGITEKMTKQAAKLISTGETVKEAFNKIHTVEVVTMSFAVTTKSKNFVQTKYGTSYLNFVMRYLMKNKELGVERPADAYKLLTKKNPTTVIKSANGKKQ